MPRIQDLHRGECMLWERMGGRSEDREVEHLDIWMALEQ